MFIMLLHVLQCLVMCFADVRPGSPTVPTKLAAAGKDSFRSSMP
jgi:hypothetical protein